MRVGRRVGSAVAAALLLMGCAAEPSPDAEESESGAEWDPEEYTAEMVACMRDAGYPAEQVTSMEAEYTLGEDTESGREALRTCEQDLADRGLLPSPSPPTPAELSSEYDELLRAAECFREEGVVVPRLPSRDAYVDGGGRSAWETLFTNVDTTDSGTVLALQETCME